MLIRNILEESVRKFDEVKAVKWLKKKEIMERSYGELMENVVSTRKGLLAEGFEGKHIALIGTSSVEWMEAIWEPSPDVPQQYRWMPHFPVRI